MKYTALVPKTPRTLRASGDRWLFGYADIVTLLFASFAALYASQASPTLNAAPSAVSGIPVVPVVPSVPSVPSVPVVPVVPASALRATSGKPVVSPLTEALREMAAAEQQIQIELTATETGTVISLAEAGSFPLGRADLTAAGARVMGQLAGLLRDQSFAIRVEGHTDDQPIRASKYLSNWELSTARAARVVEFLVTTGGLRPDRLSAAGYGEFRPRVANDNAAARARNRRVDIVVLDGAQAGPATADYSPVGPRPERGR